MGRDESLEKRLADAVLDLALPGDPVLAHKPVGSHGPDKLALEFDEAYTAYVSNLQRLPADAQLQSLQAIDSALSAMSGPENAELWTENSLKAHPRWVEIRNLAREAASRFGWSRT